LVQLNVGKNRIAEVADSRTAPSAHRNQGSHNLNGSLQYRLSPHMDLRLADSFLDTTGLLQQFQNGLGTPVTGPVNQPNQTLDYAAGQEPEQYSFGGLELSVQRR